MTNIPHQTIMRSVEGIMQCDGQFHDSQSSTEMASGLADRVEQKLAHFLGEIL